MRIAIVLSPEEMEARRRRLSAGPEPLEPDPDPMRIAERISEGVLVVLPADLLRQLDADDSGNPVVDIYHRRGDADAGYLYTLVGEPL